MDELREDQIELAHAIVRSSYDLRQGKFNRLEALLRATKNEDSQIAGILMDAGSDPDYENAFVFAAKSGCPQIVK